MSRIAGRLSVQMGAWALQRTNGGSGILLGGLPGVPPGKVVVIGAGTSGSFAVRAAVGIGAEVTVFDISGDRLSEVDEAYQGRVRTCLSEPLTLEHYVCDADLVIGALLLPGRLAPKLIDRRMLRRMRTGSVLLDIAIDQGGIAETSHPTSHSNPLFEAEGVLHYCVPNMPAACPRTATLALTQATLPYVRRLAANGPQELRDDPHLRAGMQVCGGQITHQSLAADTARPFVDPTMALSQLTALSTM